MNIVNPQTSIPSDLVGFFIASCPSGWAEYTGARGRYIVGTPDGGDMADTVGTALTNKQDRSVGQHNHTSTFSGSALATHTHTFSGTELGTHNHTQNAHSHLAPQGWSNNGLFNYVARGGNGNRVDIQTAANTTATNVAITAGTPAGSNAAITGGTPAGTISVANSGSVASTNAPYIQLICCKKN